MFCIFSYLFWLFNAHLRAYLTTIHSCKSPFYVLCIKQFCIMYKHFMICHLVIFNIFLDGSINVLQNFYEYKLLNF